MMSKAAEVAVCREDEELPSGVRGRCLMYYQRLRDNRRMYKIAEDAIQSMNRDYDALCNKIERTKCKSGAAYGILDGLGEEIRTVKRDVKDSRSKRERMRHEDRLKDLEKEKSARIAQIEYYSFKVDKLYGRCEAITSEIFKEKKYLKRLNYLIESLEKLTAEDE